MTLPEPDERTFPDIDPDHPKAPPRRDIPPIGTTTAPTPPVSFGNPVKGRIGPPGQPDPASRFVVTRGFGDGSLPQYGTHDGLDIDNGGPSGDAIIAIERGTVYQAFFDAGSGGAGIVRVRHDNGWTSGYAHMNRIDVKVGQVVTKGQQLGTLDSTGWVTGPHLHFDTTHSGDRVDPWPRLAQNQGAGGVSDVKIKGTWVGHIVNKRSALTSTGNFRSGPFNDAPVLTQYPAGTGFQPTVVVKGDSNGTASDRLYWYGGWLYENGAGWQFGYLHSSLLTRTADKQGVLWKEIEATGSGHTDAELAAAATRGADSVLEAAKTAAKKFGAT